MFCSNSLWFGFQLLVADVYNHKFHKIFAADESLSHVLDRDDIFVFVSFPFKHHIRCLLIEWSRVVLSVFAAMNFLATIQPKALRCRSFRYTVARSGNLHRIFMRLLLRFRDFQQVIFILSVSTQCRARRSRTRISCSVFLFSCLCHEVDAPTMSSTTASSITCRELNQHPFLKPKIDLKIP